MLKRNNKYKILRFLGHQEWIRLGIRDYVIRTFIPPGGKSYDFVIDYYGLKYKGNFADYIDWYVYFYGAYEKENLSLVKNLLCKKASPISIDVGAHRGVYTLFLSTFCKQVHAFEPYSKVADALQQNIDINNCKNVQLHRVALDEIDDYKYFWIPPDVNSGLGYLGGLEHNLSEDDSTKIIKVKVVNGDDYIEKLQLEKIDFIKIDTEGNERHVLRGLKRTIEIYRPIILMEFFKSTLRSFANEDEFKSQFKDYKIFEIKVGIPFLISFNKSPYNLIDFKFSNVTFCYCYLLCTPL